MRFDRRAPGHCRVAATWLTLIALPPASCVADVSDTFEQECDEIPAGPLASKQRPTPLPVIPGQQRDPLSSHLEVYDGSAVFGVEGLIEDLIPEVRLALLESRTMT